MHGRFPAALAALLAFTTVTIAAPTPVAAKPLDPEATTPYLWRVVVRTAPHPTLTAAFRTQLLRDLRGALAPLLGEELGRVEMVDLAAPPATPDPLWAAVEKHGLAAMDDADKFKDFRKLTGMKTHFLTVGFADGKYVLEARQHDGSTGLVSPVVRRGETVAAETVGRVAGLLVGRDFGPVGTAEAIPGEPNRALVRFRGGRLPGFDRMIREGDVLAFATVKDEQRPAPPDAKPTRPKSGAPTAVPTDRVGSPMAHTLLRVTHVLPDGEAKCDLLHGRVSSPLGVRGVAGFRCLKLTTAEAVVAVRLVDKGGKPPPPTTPVRLWAGEGGFEDASTPRTAIDRRGEVYAGTRPVKGVACLTVTLGSDRQWKFALPVVDGAAPPTLLFEYNPDLVAQADFEEACERQRGRLMDAALARQELAAVLRKLITAAKNEDALKRATDAQAADLQLDAEQTAELEKLRRNPLAKGEEAARLLAANERQLAALRGGRDGLAKRVEDLKIAVAKANDPIKYEKEFRIHEKQRDIDLHLSLGEVPEALALYDELFELSQNERAKQLKEKLAAEWKTADAAHEAARKYAAEEFRTATGQAPLADIKAAVPKLKAAVAALAARKDRYGLRAAKAAISTAAVRLNELAGPLDRSVATDKAELNEIEGVSKALQAVEEEATAAAKAVDDERKAEDPKPDEPKK